jgi:mannosylglycoprotein endo-beta-mannosidase
MGGSTGIMLNCEDSAYFKAGKGLRQGDPLSPFLFNLVGDGLSKMLTKASNIGLVKGLLEDFRPWGDYIPTICR